LNPKWIFPEKNLPGEQRQPYCANNVRIIRDFKAPGNQRTSVSATFAGLP